MRKNLSLPISLLVIGMVLTQYTAPMSTSAGPRPEPTSSLYVPPSLARLSDEITIRAARRGNPFINLTDGRALQTNYLGDGRAVRALEQNQVRGMSLVSGDFDQDGADDLVCGYATGDGSGVVALHRGNVDLINPNSPRAQRRRARGEFTDAPFLAPARVFEVPAAPEFLGAGDFDGDGNRDLVAATRGGATLYLLCGDGHSAFETAKRIELLEE